MNANDTKAALIDVLNEVRTEWGRIFTLERLWSKRHPEVRKYATILEDWTEEVRVSCP
jgi:hypothetical protein